MHLLYKVEVKPHIWKDDYDGQMIFSASLCSEHTYSDHSWRCLPQPGTKRLGERILRMEDAGTSEEDDDIDSQDSNTPIDHGHLARKCSIKIITTAVRPSVIPFLLQVRKNPDKSHPGNLSRSGIEPGPAAWQARLLAPSPQRLLEMKKLRELFGLPSW